MVAEVVEHLLHPHRAVGDLIGGPAVVEHAPQVAVGGGVHVRGEGAQRAGQHRAEAVLPQRGVFLRVHLHHEAVHGAARQRHRGAHGHHVAHAVLVHDVHHRFGRPGLDLLYAGSGGEQQAQRRAAGQQGRRQCQRDDHQ